MLWQPPGNSVRCSGVRFVLCTPLQCAFDEICYLIRFAHCSRCESALHNPVGEADHLAEAAQHFLAAEYEDREEFGTVGFEANVADAISCYERAIEVGFFLTRTE